MRFCNQILQIYTTFCHFSRLNKDKFSFNLIDKKVIECSSVPFETCKLFYYVSPLPVLTFQFIGTKSSIIQHPQKGEFTNSRICSIFVNNQIKGKKQVCMTNLSINS